MFSLDTVEAFLGTGLGGLCDYRYARVHSGYGMAGRTPYACCVALVFSGSECVGVMPVVLLDDRVLYQSPSQSLLITRQTLQRLPYPIPTH